MDRIVKLDIGNNLLKAIVKMIDGVNKENLKPHTSMCPGEAVRKAFGIDMVKIHENELLELRKRTEL